MQNIENKSLRRRAPRFDLIAGNVCLDFVNTLDDRHVDDRRITGAAHVPVVGVVEPGAEAAAAATEALEHYRKALDLAKRKGDITLADIVLSRIKMLGEAPL